MKYIDLLDRIAEDYGDPCGNIQLGMNAALRWLDEHPDQVPGRTITESKADRLYQEARAIEHWGWRQKLVDIGITVVPDPEPTNADRLADLMEQAYHPNRVLYAENLDSLGVKAPEAGGDDE